VRLRGAFAPTSDHFFYKVLKDRFLTEGPNLVDFGYLDVAVLGPALQQGNVATARLDGAQERHQLLCLWLPLLLL
jgi:hypothetical protein